jgi:hypothetical protein
MSVLEIAAVIAIIGYVIGRQLLGEHLRGKRLIVLPIILAAIGVSELLGHGEHPAPTDICLIAVGAVVAAGIGIRQGLSMCLEARDGTLWGQMPLRSLWLWLGLVASRIVIDVVATGMHAHVAAGTAPILFTLGINRLAQASVVAPRAMAAGIPFTPEKNGSVFMANVFGSSRQGPAEFPSSQSLQPGTANSQWQTGIRIIADRFSATPRGDDS